MTLILFFMSIVLAQDCAQTCNVCSQPPCTFCPGHFGYTPDLSTRELIFEVYGPMAVSSGPGDTSFTIPRGRTITDIGTYHWYGQRGSVGTIGLQNVDSGTLYGPWQASGYAGMHGAQDVYWVVSPYVYLPAGTYKIVDSDQSTWSYTPNDCTGSEGHCWVFAKKENVDGSSTSQGKEASPATPCEQTNLALHKLASQSSTATDWGGNWDASRGVDGVKTGNIFDGGFHTDSENSPWWQVDLGAMHDLDYALLYNRQDCCGERAGSLEVLLSDDGQSWQSVYKHDRSIFGGTDGHPLKVGLNGQKARLLRVQLRETNWLHLDEVEVFGCQ